MAGATLISATNLLSLPIAATMEDKPLTFTLFSKLPIELRLKIWEYFNEPEARDVQVKILSPTNNDLARSAPKCQSLTPIPAILHICHDARQVGLKTYEKVFKVRDGDGEGRLDLHQSHVDLLVIHVPEVHVSWAGCEYVRNGGPSIYPLTLLNSWKSLGISITWDLRVHNQKGSIGCFLRTMTMVVKGHRENLPTWKERSPTEEDMKAVLLRFGDHGRRFHVSTSWDVDWRRYWAIILAAGLEKDPVALRVSY